MSNFTEPLNNLVKDGEQYVNAQMDSLKLHSIKGLSMGLSTVASLLLIFILGSVLLLALSFALVMWLGQLLGSYVLSAFIVAGVLFIALVTCLLLRERLFKNTFVGPLRDGRPCGEPGAGRCRRRAARRRCGANTGILYP